MLAQRYLKCKIIYEAFERGGGSFECRRSGPEAGDIFMRFGRLLPFEMLAEPAFVGVNTRRARSSRGMNGEFS